MTDFGLKTAFLTVKVCQAVSQSPFGVGTSSLDIMCFSIGSRYDTIRVEPETVRSVLLPV